MKKTLKFLTLLWILVLIFSLQGCGTVDEDAGEKKNDREDIGETGEAEDTRDENDTSDTRNEEEQNTTNGLGTGVDADGVNIGEQVLFDQKNIRITAISLDEGGFLGPEIKVLIENNSNDNITVQVRELSVNGYMMEPSFSSDVAAGMKANDSIIFLTEDMEVNQIKEIATVEFRFDIFNSETWDTIVESDIVVIKTNTNYIQEYDASGNVVFEGNGFKIVEKGVDTSNEIMGPQIRFYIENNTEETVTVQARDVSVNGIMVEATFSRDITPGKKANDGLLFLDLEDNDIEEITNADLKFDIFNAESWKTIVETDVIKLDFK